MEEKTIIDNEPNINIGDILNEKLKGGNTEEKAAKKAAKKAKKIAKKAEKIAKNPFSMGNMLRAAREGRKIMKENKDVIKDVAKDLPDDVPMDLPIIDNSDSTGDKDSSDDNEDVQKASGFLGSLGNGFVSIFNGFLKIISFLGTPFKGILKILFFYLKYILPVVLGLCIIFTLVGMLISLGTQFGIAVAIFILGVLIAGVILYGPEKIFNIFTNNKVIKNTDANNNNNNTN